MPASASRSRTRSSSAYSIDRLLAGTFLEYSLGRLLALSFMTIFAVSLVPPDVEGVKFTVKVQLEPAPKVFGLMGQLFARTKSPVYVPAI